MNSDPDSKTGPAAKLPVPVVLADHEAKYPASCMAWGVELLLKVHRKLPLGDYSVQKANQSDWGYAGARDRLAEDGIELYEDSWDVPEVLTRIEAEVRAGRCPLISVPTQAVLNPWLHKIEDFTCHLFTAVIVEERLIIATRAYGSAKMHSNLDLPKYWRFLETLRPNYRVHCLFER